MRKILKKRLPISQVVWSSIFLAIQVIATLYLPTLTSNIVNDGIAKGDIHYIWIAGIQMLGCSLISVAAAIFNSYFSAKGSQKLGQNLRSDVYRKVINYSHDEMEQIGTSSLVTRTTNDIMQIQNVALMFMRMMLMAPMMLVLASIMAYRKSPTLTLIFIIVLPIIAIIMALVIHFAGPLFGAMQQKLDKVNTVFREGLTGVRVIRAFRQDDFEQERFDKVNKDYTHNAIKVYNITGLMMPLMTVIMSMTNIGITLWGSHLIANQAIEVGNMIAFITYASQILMSFVMMSMVFVFIPRAQASAQRLNEVLDMETEIKDAQNPISLADKPSALDFDNVDFRYHDAQKDTLEGVNFKMKAGQTLAIIGGTGSGKSTLVNLIPRFYDATEGTVKINGVNVKDTTLHDVHEQVAFVPQKANLFTGTLRENMQYGNQNATDEEIWHALDIAQASDFVKELDGQLDAHVEQGGLNFSGGQRQRLAIARALVKKASVYVFDDSFSALDFKTDANLRHALKQDTEMQKHVVVIVGQRVSTVADADLIIVLDKGEMVGAGTHQELMQNNDVYKAIVDSQIREEKDGAANA
ncbi:MAG TPA: ABC transporter ATP-binding protein/permease [Candidatus Ligilactobacillus excrementigallinarum]|uniref:ABC transporter ATP-binding protein/permease n=1 Tax=Candidatus Ligilactobacillus excrementigallinarum TaxID=2838641 RepID=A0A9D1UX33_9LACO|nr:ABC transporter ATP-binding protein/permease [Candidatus Ligilactobacillus excrementigallinarum]